MQGENIEVILLSAIRETPPGPIRDSLIDELEATPEYMRSFCERWFYIHWSYAEYEKCWSSKGFDPSKSTFSRHVLLLAAARYGKSDIENGGFHQFFSNHTGTYAPEMVEWFENVSLMRVAFSVRQAMEVFGTAFPRSQGVRQRFLWICDGEEYKPWNPFGEFDDMFYDAMDDDAYSLAADHWLRTTCGIQKLKQRN